MCDDALERLNSAKYVYLRELSEPRDNSLRLVLEEAVSNHAGVRGLPNVELSSELQHILREAVPIEPVEGCAVFELYWKRYVAYLVTEECVGSCGSKECADESYTGRILRSYGKSHFLDHIARDTGGHFETVLHHKVICLNHLIDVAAYAPPDVRVLALQGSPHSQNQ